LTITWLKGNSAEQKGLADEEFTGWCVLNSTERQNEREQHGFQGTSFTSARNKASYAVRLFLNICASYLKAKKNNEGDGRKASNFFGEQKLIDISYGLD
jgi:hypothetical protein